MFLISVLITGVFIVGLPTRLGSKAAWYSNNVVPTGFVRCGVEGGSCCNGSLCFGKLASGQTSQCLSLTTFAEGKKVTNNVCGLPIIVMDVYETPQKNVAVRLETNAVGFGGKPYIYNVECRSGEEGSVILAKESAKKVEILSCDFPDLGTPKTYQVKGWVKVLRGPKATAVGPVFKNVTIGADHSFLPGQ